MLATPPRREDHQHRDLRFVVAMAALYAAPGILIWVAARLAGGQPRADVWNWPARGIAAALKHQALAPWTWDGAPTVASPALFYTILALVALVGATAGVVGNSVLQGGVVAWSPNAFRRARRVAAISSGQLRGLRVKRSQPGRIVVGQRRSNLLATRPGESLAVLGASGAGKTSAVCVPAIVEWRGPVVAVGIGQDLVGPTAGIRQRHGMVEIFDPAVTTGLGTCSWSPVAGCESLSAAARRAGWMQTPSVMEPGLGAPAGPQGEAVGALLAVSLWAAAQNGVAAGELAEWLHDPDCRSLRAAIARSRPAEPRARSCLEALDKLPAPDRAACCRAVQELLAGAGEGQTPDQPPFHPGEFVRAADRGAPTLYVLAPPNDPERTAAVRCGLLGALLDEAFAMALGRGRPPSDQRLLVVLDGIPRAAPVRELAQHLAVAGQLGVTLLVTFEDLVDVERAYRSGAGEVVASAQAVVFLGPQTEARTLRLLGDLAQSATVVGSAGLLGRGQGLLISEGLPPVPMWTRPWIHSRSLRELVHANPYAGGVGWIEAVASGH